MPMLGLWEKTDLLKKITLVWVLGCFIAPGSGSASGYCFQTQDQRDRARTTIMDFLLKSESVQVVDHQCLFINLKNPQREELIDHLLRPFSPAKSLKTTSTSKRTCLFELYEAQERQLKTTQVKFPQKINLRTTHSNTQANQMIRIEGQEAEEISLGLDDTRLRLICYPKSKAAEIVLKYYSQKGPSVSTRLELPLGVQKEIGEVIKDLKRDDKDIGLDRGVVLSDETGKAQTKVSLKLISID